jgi:phosphoglycerate dehydrogenase-like enzyme
MVIDFGGPFMTSLLNDQAINNTSLRWVHSLSAGIDELTTAIEFANSTIPLTNGKGASSGGLAEFIALGMLFHSKKVPYF